MSPLTMSPSGPVPLMLERGTYIRGRNGLRDALKNGLI